ncbi:hypothetical protein PS627_04021 [Pseudomonas fluorescens]|uniref:bifunctional diguanylate cyclase/phosphodiesterase n=1 Tax=Pseudomonas fluorescens TaxID=294 RepID=UPI001257CDF6|nr:EAL domain-containing protein [Pseudomonas fluorescens]CAG8870514.1 hypothetical protein PS627_04021 [Pseudomonas fluorescens]VVP69220.1 hypothetical protein PS910_00541 [Pseudomonas fluorescens]
MEAVSGKRTSSRQVVTRRLILIFAGLMGLALAVGVASLYRIAGTLDEREARQSRFYAQSALQGFQKTQQAFLLSYAFWQVGYDHLEGTVNRHWAYDEDNVGPTLYNNSGYEGVFVIDDGKTGYAMLDGQLSDAPIEQFTEAKAQILQQARVASQRDQAASGFVMFRGQPALFVAAVIRPPAMQHHLPAPRSVMTFIRPLAPAVLEPLGESVGLQGFAVSPAGAATPARGYLALAETGHGLTWDIHRPGSELVWAVVPPLAVALAFILVMMSVLGRYAVRSSARIDRSYQQLAESRDALEISEERFKAVAESASDWIWESDAHLQITYLSARFAQLTGHSVDAWIGRSIKDLLECDTGRVAHWLQQLAVSGAAGSLRCQYHDSLGQLRICRISARAILHGGEHEGFRGTSTDITDEVAAHAQIQHLSQHDALTGLPNRNKLFRFIEQAMQTGDDPQLAVLMLDLDNFKPINDTLGHSAGDAVLIEVATRLNGVTRGADLVARLGGDEFIVVLTQPGSRESLDRFCERLIQSLRAPLVLEEQQVRISASLGLVLSREHGGQPADLIKYADLALYSAKAAGKGTWRYFSAQHNEALLGKRTLERELREGIARGQLVLHFQPRFKVDGVTVASAEALVRWQHPQRGLMRPDEFIALAEESDLIVLLGNWVIREACARARDWPLEVMVSVNMSPAQFSRSDVVRDVREALIETQLPAHRLELEITENVMLNDIEGALHTMNALKELGVRLNMDDFGTGYSSLGYLRTYPFDSIKIDKRFVQSLGKSESDRSVVQAIINLGNAMGMTVTAEGVETEDQLNLLSADQCHEVQGFLLSKPIDNDALVRLMGRVRIGAGAYSTAQAR